MCLGGLLEFLEERNEKHENTHDAGTLLKLPPPSTVVF